MNVTPWDILRQLCPRLYKRLYCFECGLGWHYIIQDLSIKIENILEKYAETYKAAEGEEDKYIEMFAVQVKEKYGTLRFYMSCETDEITNLIREAEAASSQICEQCGSPGKMRGTSWVSVRCDKCHQETK